MALDLSTGTQFHNTGIFSDRISESRLLCGHGFPCQFLRSRYHVLVHGCDHDHFICNRTEELVVGAVEHSGQPCCRAGDIWQLSNAAVSWTGVDVFGDFLYYSISCRGL
jgi:hypothetical protein